MIEFEHISKTYGSLRANDDISCSVGRGKIHAFLGENGAGKSTLVKILAGYEMPDGGRLKLDGQTVHFRSPADAKKRGIGMVHQQFSLIPKLKIWQNLVIGDSRLSLFFSEKKIKRQVNTLLKEIGLELDLDRLAGDLNPADRQIAEIVKLLWGEHDILIMDEPLSQLSFLEGERILELIAGIVRIKQKTVILISHNISEILAYADQVTVLKKGKVVATVAAQGSDERELAGLMLGREQQTKVPAEQRSVLKEEPLVSLRGVTTIQRGGSSDIALRGIDLDILPGEILGIAGVNNNGQETLLKLLNGNIGSFSGQLAINGVTLSNGDIREKLRVGYIPAEALREGCVPGMSVRENLFFKQIGAGVFDQGLRLNHASIRIAADDMIGRFDIQPADNLLLAGQLSGGNLQKLIIARETGANYQLLLAANPLSGLDLGFSGKLLAMFVTHRNEGRTILFQSNNITQLFEICDRIAVFNRGLLSGVLTKSDYNLDKMALLMTGLNTIHHENINDR
ncbi:ABC transporter ATP-binding protein [Mucilaginibacter sp. HD30]